MEYTMSDRQILQKLGEGVRRERLVMNWTQAALAERAGVGKRTVQNAERGEGMSVGTLVALMRALGIAERLALLFPEPELSPVRLAKLKRRDRQRATGSRGGATVEGGEGELGGGREGYGGSREPGGSARVAEGDEEWSWGE